jgi:hypothetical protein
VLGHQFARHRLETSPAAIRHCFSGTPRLSGAPVLSSPQLSSQEAFLAFAADEARLGRLAHALAVGQELAGAGQLQGVGHPSGESFMRRLRSVFRELGYILIHSCSGGLLFEGSGSTGARTGARVDRRLQIRVFAAVSKADGRRPPMRRTGGRHAEPAGASVARPPPFGRGSGSDRS